MSDETNVGASPATDQPTARTVAPLPLTNPEDAASVDWEAVGVVWTVTEPETADGKATGKRVPLSVAEKGQTYHGAQLPLPVDLDKLRLYVPDAIILGSLDASGWRIPAQRVCRAVLSEWRTQKLELVKINPTTGERIENINPLTGNVVTDGTGKPQRVSPSSVGVLDTMHEKLLRKRVWDSLMGIRGETKRTATVVTVTKIVDRPVISGPSGVYDGPADVDEIRSWFVGGYADVAEKMGIPSNALLAAVPNDEIIGGWVAAMVAAAG